MRPSGPVFGLCRVCPKDGYEHHYTGGQSDTVCDESKLNWGHQYFKFNVMCAWADQLQQRISQWKWPMTLWPQKDEIKRLMVVIIERHRREGIVSSAHNAFWDMMTVQTSGLSWPYSCPRPFLTEQQQQKPLINNEEDEQR